MFCILLILFRLTHVHRTWARAITSIHFFHCELSYNSTCICGVPTICLYVNLYRQLNLFTVSSAFMYCVICIITWIPTRLCFVSLLIDRKKSAVPNISNCSVLLTEEYLLVKLLPDLRYLHLLGLFIICIMKMMSFWMRGKKRY